MKILKIHKPILEMVLTEYLKHYIWKLNYYNDLHDPEYRFNHGISLDSEVHFAQEELEAQKGNVQYHRNEINANDLTKVSFQFLNKLQFFEAVKEVIRKQLTFAYEHNTNKYIVARGLKRSVLALDLLRLNEPKFAEVTPRFFLHYNNLN